MEPEQHQFVSICLPLVADVSDITRFLSVFNEPHVGVIQAARQLLSDERAPLRQKLLADLLQHVSQNITAETREQDPSWFEGKSRWPWWPGCLGLRRISCLFQILVLLSHSWTGLWSE